MKKIILTMLTAAFLSQCVTGIAVFAADPISVKLTDKDANGKADTVSEVTAPDTAKYIYVVEYNAETRKMIKVTKKEKASFSAVEFTEGNKIKVIATADNGITPVSKNAEVEPYAAPDPTPSPSVTPSPSPSTEPSPSAKTALEKAKEALAALDGKDKLAKYDAVNWSEMSTPLPSVTPSPSPSTEPSPSVTPSPSPSTEPSPSAKTALEKAKEALAALDGKDKLAEYDEAKWSEMSTPKPSDEPVSEALNEAETALKALSGDDKLKKVDKTHWSKMLTSLFE